MTFVLIDKSRASPTEIAALEQRVGMRLPEDYKLFLAENNGGQCVSGGVFRELATGETVSRVNIVLGATDDPDFSIEQSLSRMAWRMPAQVLPIAYDGSGNYVLLDCSNERRGTVYFLALDSDPRESSSVDSLVVVDRSFTGFRAQVEADN